MDTKDVNGASQYGNATCTSLLTALQSKLELNKGKSLFAGIDKVVVLYPDEMLQRVLCTISLPYLYNYNTTR